MLETFLYPECQIQLTETHRLRKMSKTPYIKINWPYTIEVFNSYPIKDELKKLGFSYYIKSWEIGIPTLIMKPWIVDKLRELGVDGVDKLEEMINDEKNTYIKIYKKIIEQVKSELPVEPLDIRVVFSRNIIKLRLPRLDKKTFMELKKKIKYDPITYEWKMKINIDWRKVK